MHLPEYSLPSRIAAVLLVGLLGTPWLQAQTGVPGDSVERREHYIARQRLDALLDSVFGRDGYHVQLNQRESGVQIVLVVDRRFQGDYSEEGLRELLASVLEMDLSAKNSFLLSSLPMTPNEKAEPDTGGISGWGLSLLGLLFIAMGGLVGWYLGARPKTAYSDELDSRLAALEKMAAEDPARVAQVLRLWLRPTVATAAESGGMTQRELAAVILLSLSRTTAAGVIQQFLPREIQQVGDIMVRIARVRRTVLRYAVKQFFEDVQEATGFGVRAEADYRNLLETALGEQRAQLIAGAPDIQSNVPLLENLRWIEAETLAELIGGEHPQVQAIVVASLDTEKATRLIECLPANVRPDVLLRIAELEKLQPDAAEAVAELIESKLASLSSKSSRTPAGRRRAAAILKSVSADWSEALWQDIYQRDQRLASVLQEQMFTLDDLLGLTHSDWDKVQQQLPDELLALALLGCRPDTREAFLQRLSKARAGLIRPLLKRFAGVGAELVEQSASEVLTLVRRLAASGDIVLGGELRLARPAMVEAP